jgi:cytochrome c oxidase subunit 3
LNKLIKNKFYTFLEQYGYSAVAFDITPFVTSLGSMFTVLNLVFLAYAPVNKFIDFNGSIYPICAVILLFTIFIPGFVTWSYNVFREAELGLNTFILRKSLILGMYLFILSEFLFFVSFFWSYFYITAAPAFEVGNMLPRDIKPLNFLSIPLYNTFILVLSGLSASLAEKMSKITYSSLQAVNNKLNFSLRVNTLAMYGISVFLGLLFTVFQLFEYKNTLFSAEDSAYGSIFFITTGFHGVHVILGTIFLIFSGYQQFKWAVTPFNNISIKFANIYWHFVDAIWIGLYLLYYYYVTLR